MYKPQLPSKLVLVLVIAVLSCAQEAPTIRATVPLLVFPASVTEKRGELINGLEGQHFEVRDNGELQTASVDLSDASPLPLALVVVIQNNAFAASALGKIRKIGIMILDAVGGENACAALLSYGKEVKVLQEFTQDSGRLAMLIRTLPATNEPDARLLDAVEQAVQRLEARSSAERKAILILGQSRDKGSKAKFLAVTEKAQRAGITIYGLTYSAFVTAFTTKASEYQPPVNGSYLEGIKALNHLGNRNTVAALVDETGGLQGSFATKGALEKQLIRLARDIHGRYLLSFTPRNPGTPGFHQIQVVIKGRPDAIVYVRKGYWAASKN